MVINPSLCNNRPSFNLGLSMTDSENKDHYFPHGRILRSSRVRERVRECEREKRERRVRERVRVRVREREFERESSFERVRESSREFERERERERDRERETERETASSAFKCLFSYMVVSCLSIFAIAVFFFWKYYQE